MDSYKHVEAKPKVLFIHSNPNSQEQFKKLLGSVFDVQTASGRDGLTTVREFVPDAIILDVDLPNHDCFSVCRLIRQEPEFTRTPMLFLSQLHGKDEQFKGFDAGGDDYIQKPVSLQALQTKITQCLERVQNTQHPTADEDNAYPELDQNIQYLHEFLLQLIDASTTTGLGDLVLSSLSKMGLKGALHWHFSDQTYSSIGPLTDLENVLLHQTKSSFPAERSARFVWGSVNVSAIIHNMPSPAHPQFQTMRQLLNTLFAATDKRISSPELLEPNASDGIDAQKPLIYGDKLEAALEALEHQSEHFLSVLSKSLQDLAGNTNIGEFERQEFHSLLNHATQARIGIYDQCLEAQSQLGLIKEHITEPA